MRSLDKKFEVLNWRDVGASLNELCGQALFRERALYRSGRSRNAAATVERHKIGTVINLDVMENRSLGRAVERHVGFRNYWDVYNISAPGVKPWIESVLTTISSVDCSAAVWVHCNRGRDRTGVAIGTLLQVVEVPRDLLIAEYQLSTGVDDIRMFESLMDATASVLGVQDNLYDRLQALLWRRPSSTPPPPAR